MSDLTLSRGQNTALSGPRPLRVEVKAGAPLDVLAFVLGTTRRSAAMRISCSSISPHIPAVR